jgi:hypothetical protein
VAERPELVESGPPPTPLARAAEAATRRRRRRTLGVLAAAAALVGLTAAALLFAPALPFAASDPAADGTRDAALLTLLTEVEAAEAQMFAFFTARGAAMAAAGSREERLSAVATAAADSAAALRTARAVIEIPSRDTVADGLRTVYLTHLDAWIAYLAAIADDPEIQMSEQSGQVYLVAINATADDFRVATEEVVAAGPADEVVALAEEILDAGFRSSGGDADA